MKSIIGESRDLNLNVSIRNIRKNQMNYKVLGKKNHFINNKYCGILIKGHNKIYIYIKRERERERERSKKKIQQLKVLYLIGIIWSPKKKIWVLNTLSHSL